MSGSNRTAGRCLRSATLSVCAVILAAMLKVTAADLPAAAPPADTPPATPPAVAPTPTTPSQPAVGTAPAAAPKRTGRIRGTVVDAARKGQPGLLVTLSSRSEPDILRVTGTDEKGQYLFQELPPGVYDLKVQAEGFQDTGKESIEVRPPFQNIVDVRLQSLAPAVPAAGSGPATPEKAADAPAAPEPAPVTVRGRFVDQDRHTLADVSVVLSSLQGHGIFQAFSGDDGVFEIPDVIPGRYRVVVRSPGHVPLDLRSVEILGKLGLTVSLMLVDYPLNFKAGQDSATPIEEPRPAPPSTVSGGGSEREPAAPNGPPVDRPGG